jgi:hypothetical protein
MACMAFETAETVHPHGRGEHTYPNTLLVKRNNRLKCSTDFLPVFYG